MAFRILGCEAFQPNCPRHSRTRGQVRRRGIEHCVMVCEWNLVQYRAIVIAIEGSPSAISVLHADHPCSAPLYSFIEPLLVSNPYPIERHKDESSVVDIRIEII